MTPAEELERQWAWAKTNPTKIFGWAALTWDGVPDLREKQTSMHMIPLVSVGQVIALEDELASSRESAGEGTQRVTVTVDEKEKGE